MVPRNHASLLFGKKAGVSCAFSHHSFVGCATLATITVTNSNVLANYSGPGHPANAINDGLSPNDGVYSTALGDTACGHAALAYRFRVCAGIDLRIGRRRFRMGIASTSGGLRACCRNISNIAVSLMNNSGTDISTGAAIAPALGISNVRGLADTSGIRILCVPGVCTGNDVASSCDSICNA